MPRHFHHVNRNRRGSTEPITTTFLSPQSPRCQMKKKKKKEKKNKVDTNTIIDNTTPATMGLSIDGTIPIIDDTGTGKDSGPLLTTTPICSISSISMALPRFIYTRLFYDDGTACMILLILGYSMYYSIFRVMKYYTYLREKRAYDKNQRHRMKFVNSVNKIARMKKVVTNATDYTSPPTFSNPTTSPITSPTTSPTATCIKKKPLPFIRGNSSDSIISNISQNSSSNNMSTKRPSLLLSMKNPKGANLALSESKKKMKEKRLMSPITTTTSTSITNKRPTFIRSDSIISNSSILSSSSAQRPCLSRSSLKNPIENFNKEKRTTSFSDSTRFNADDWKEMQQCYDDSDDDLSKLCDQ